MEKLFTLLELQHQAQEAQSRAALLHVIVNETRKVVPYTTAVFWSPSGMSLRCEKSSGNAPLDADGPYAGQVILAARSVKPESAAAVVHKLNREQHGAEGAVLLFKTDAEGLLGGLWLEHDRAYNDAEIRILEELAAIYAPLLALWNLRGRSILPSFGSGRKRGYAVMAGFLLLCFLPVRMGITAPAEIVSREAQIVTAPFDGTIEQVHVEPGDDVTKGSVIVSMESRSLQAQMELAEQEMRISQSNLSRIQRESLSQPDKKSGLTELQEEIESKKINFDYARSLKDRSEITADRAGVAVFSDASSLRGRPVRTGDKILMIADPSSYELLIRVPVESMIPVEKDAPVRFFLNISPFSGQDAAIRSVGYQASADADGLMTYKILATLPEDASLRIGWKGTAKIKGEWTTLSYVILRRPLIGLRNMLGV